MSGFETFHRPRREPASAQAGVCPVCGASVRLYVSGQIRDHYPDDLQYGRILERRAYCRGGQQWPEPPNPEWDAFEALTRGLMCVSKADLESEREKAALEGDAA